MGFALLIAILFAFVPVVGEITGASMTAAVLGGVGGAGVMSLATTAGFIGMSLVNG